MVFFYLFPEILDDRHRRLDTQIAHDKRFFDLLVEIIIDRGKTAEYGINSAYDGISRFRQPFYQTAEKTPFLLSHACASLSISALFFAIIILLFSLPAPSAPRSG